VSPPPARWPKRAASRVDAAARRRPLDLLDLLDLLDAEIGHPNRTDPADPCAAGSAIAHAPEPTRVICVSVPPGRAVTNLTRHSPADRSPRTDSTT
jgi:hypothetical protein